MSQFEFGKYCSPAQLYLVVAVIGIAAGFLKNFRVFTLLYNSLFAVLWAWILNFLCRKGLTALSWILVLLPFILLASAFFLSMDAADKKDEEVLEGMHASGEPLPEATDEETMAIFCEEHPDHEMCVAIE